MDFSDLQLAEPVLRAVVQEKYTTPTPIQEKAIPHLLAGKDMLGCAQTGTGKTAAFALPIINALHAKPNTRRGRAPRALVLAPTRELAAQVGASFSAYGKFAGVKTTVIFGGVGQGPQVGALRGGVDVVVATPGRLVDLLNQKHIDLRKIETFVLDEADHMLDLGFIHDVKNIVGRIPAERQTLLFSATMPKEIAALADSILRDPVKVAVAPISSPVESVDQSVYHVAKENKRNLLVDLLKNGGVETALVFSRTKHGADKIAKTLNGSGIKAMAIHGNKSQSARNDALGAFKKGSLRVLVATDIAARGIDVQALPHVLNYDLPDVPETYVHRIGRTGRAGLRGTAISFCDTDERGMLRDIERLISLKLPVVKDHPMTIAPPAPDAVIVSAPPARRGNRPNRQGGRPGQQSRQRRKPGFSESSNGNRPSVSGRPGRNRKPSGPAFSRAAS